MLAEIKRRPLLGGVLSSSLHPVIDKIYRARNVSSIAAVSNQAKSLLHYRDLMGIDSAVTLLSEALEKQQKIIIVGDFDADGATSTALCMLALRAMGGKNIEYLVPNRFNFGYGLSPGIVDVAEQQGGELIITVDSGIACLEGVAHAKKLGLKVIVTDHHLPPEVLPNADAIVNPNLSMCGFDSKNLAGVGVAFYVMSALRAHLTHTQWFINQNISAPSMAQWLDIVAVGTVADVVVLDENNRILVHQGLQRIRAGQCRPGIRALFDIANRPIEHLSASDLGFVIGPRLNAAGRLEDMALGIECLLADNTYAAREIAAKLDSLNQQRKQIEQDMKQDAGVIVEQIIAEQGDNVPAALVLHDDNFHQGVIGIVAGRLKDQFDRPTIVFANQDEHLIKGSARSVKGVHVRDALETVQRLSGQIIEKFGGHAMAAGLTLQKQHLEAFTHTFTQAIQSMRENVPDRKVFLTDGGLSDTDINLNFVQQLQQAGPFGQGFPAPSFDDEFELVSQRVVGEKHLKMLLRTEAGSEIDAIAFNIDVTLWPNKQAKKVRVVYLPDINVFRGRKTVQLLVEHMQPC